MAIKRTRARTRTHRHTHPHAYVTVRLILAKRCQKDEQKTQKVISFALFERWILNIPVNVWKNPLKDLLVAADVVAV